MDGEVGRVFTQVKSQSWRVRFVSVDQENTAETRGHPADPHRALWRFTADTDFKEVNMPDFFFIIIRLFFHVVSP